MKRLFCLICVSFLAVTSLSAQDYTWAVGTRIGGDMSGLSGKYNFDASNSVEVVLAIPYDPGFNMLGLYERNIPVIGDGFHFYYGAGMHIGSWSYNKDKQSFVLGIDGVIGLEYGLKDAPLAFSLDYKPALNFFGHTGMHFESVGLGIKLTF